MKDQSRHVKQPDTTTPTEPVTGDLNAPPTALELLCELVELLEDNTVFFGPGRGMHDEYPECHWCELPDRERVAYGWKYKHEADCPLMLALAKAERLFTESDGVDREKTP